MRYRYAVIYSRFRWRRSGTRSYIADLVDCRLWLLGGSHLLKKLDIIAIICYNRGVIGAGYLLYQIIHCRSGTRSHITCWCWGTPMPACARVRPHATHPYARIRAGRAGSRGELGASWKLRTPWRAGRELENLTPAGKCAIIKL